MQNLNARPIVTVSPSSTQQTPSVVRAHQIILVGLVTVHARRPKPTDESRLSRKPDFQPQIPPFPPRPPRRAPPHPAGMQRTQEQVRIVCVHAPQAAYLEWMRPAELVRHPALRMVQQLRRRKQWHERRDRGAAPNPWARRTSGGKEAARDVDGRSDLAHFLFVSERERVGAVRRRSSDKKTFRRRRRSEVEEWERRARVDERAEVQRR